jgi:hypothetical protein
MSTRTAILAKHPLFANAAVFAKVISTVASVIDGFGAARLAGYQIIESWAWKPGTNDAVGIMRVEQLGGKKAGRVLFTIEWDVGAGRPPEAQFRLTSRHGRALIEALIFVRQRVLGADQGDQGPRRDHRRHLRRLSLHRFPFPGQ